MGFNIGDKVQCKYFAKNFNYYKKCNVPSMRNELRTYEEKKHKKLTAIIIDISTFGGELVFRLDEVEWWWLAEDFITIDKYKLRGGKIICVG